MIKAVFFDIDGTLVSFQTHEVPPSTVEALAALRERGVKVFIATGRHKDSIDNLGTLEFDGYVTLNGGYCWADGQAIYKHPIPRADIDSLIRFEQEVKRFPCALVEEDGLFQNYIDDTARQLYGLLNFPLPPLRPLEENNSKEVFQLIAFFRDGEEEQQIMAALPHCEATRWNPLFADVVPQGSSKAIGIDKIIAHYGIRLEETMAFGDGGNDILMLRHAGIGVAMGNSTTEVQAAADWVTTSVDEDGIMNALRHFGVI